MRASDLFIAKRQINQTFIARIRCCYNGSLQLKHGWKNEQKRSGVTDP